MRKRYLTGALAILLLSSTTLTSCIGSFNLTKSVLGWNNQVGNKFVNELVFFAFWILPVYEVTGLADILVLNSIEFWSGRNPMSASVKSVDTDHGRYVIACDGKGYDITNELTGDTVRLDFTEDTQTWSVKAGDEDIPFMTMLDDSHVRMITPAGTADVELTPEGVMAYEASIPAPVLMAAR